MFIFLLYLKYKNIFSNDMKNKDIFWMKKALSLAKHAMYCNEIPVGAILVFNDQLLSYAWNQSLEHCDPTAHAEIIALRLGGKKTKNYRLMNITMYVTLEPCLMCLGAILHSRISRLVFGAKNKKINSQMILHNDKIQITGGILESSCAIILKNFFYSRRKNFVKNI